MRQQNSVSTLPPWPARVLSSARSVLRDPLLHPRHTRVVAVDVESLRQCDAVLLARLRVDKTLPGLESDKMLHATQRAARVDLGVGVLGQIVCAAPWPRAVVRTAGARRARAAVVTDGTIVGLVTNEGVQVVGWKRDKSVGNACATGFPLGRAATSTLMMKRYSASGHSERQARVHVRVRVRDACVRMQEGGADAGAGSPLRSLHHHA